ncbi:hypothetical protein C8R45DRAFT_1040279 [Mycena sanguinolenta]|nr:hypothetical protein C8R45DRAFT_1040279 [Mycena sanguinolenta]
MYSGGPRLQKTETWSSQSAPGGGAERAINGASSSLHAPPRYDEAWHSPHNIPGSPSAIPRSLHTTSARPQEEQRARRPRATSKHKKTASARLRVVCLLLLRNSVRTKPDSKDSARHRHVHQPPMKPASASPAARRRNGDGRTRGTLHKNGKDHAHEMKRTGTGEVHDARCTLATNRSLLLERGRPPQRIFYPLRSPCPFRTGLHSAAPARKPSKESTPRLGVAARSPVTKNAPPNHARLENKKTGQR